MTDTGSFERFKAQSGTPVSICLGLLSRQMADWRYFWCDQLGQGPDTPSKPGAECVGYEKEVVVCSHNFND